MGTQREDNQPEDLSDACSYLEPIGSRPQTAFIQELLDEVNWSAIVHILDSHFQGSRSLLVCNTRNFHGQLHIQMLA